MAKKLQKKTREKKMLEKKLERKIKERLSKCSLPRRHCCCPFLQLHASSFRAPIKE
jgi:hypothetical protein